MKNTFLLTMLIAIIGIVLVFCFFFCFSSSGLLIYDYIKNKKIAFIKTPKEMGFYREMIIENSPKNGCFFTTQRVSSHSGSEEGFILRKRDQKGIELSRFSFKGLISTDSQAFSLSPDQKTLIYSGRDVFKIPHIYRIDLSKDSNIAPEVVFKKKTLFPGITSFAWFDNTSFVCLVADWIPNSLSKNKKEKEYKFIFVDLEKQLSKVLDYSPAFLLSSGLTENQKLKVVTLLTKSEIIVLNKKLDEIFKIWTGGDSHKFKAKWHSESIICYWSNHSGRWVFLDIETKKIISSGVFEKKEEFIFTNYLFDGFFLATRRRSHTYYLYNIKTCLFQKIVSGFGSGYEISPSRVILEI